MKQHGGPARCVKGADRRQGSGASLKISKLQRRIRIANEPTFGNTSPLSALCPGGMHAGWVRWRGRVAQECVLTDCCKWSW